MEGLWLCVRRGCCVLVRVYVRVRVRVPARVLCLVLPPIFEAFSRLFASLLSPVLVRCTIDRVCLGRLLLLPPSPSPSPPPSLSPYPYPSRSVADRPTNPAPVSNGSVSISTRPFAASFNAMRVWLRPF